MERTLQQLQSTSGGRASGHVMYSDDAPQPDGIPPADSPDAAFTQGRGVLVRKLTAKQCSDALITHTHTVLQSRADLDWILPPCLQQRPRLPAHFHFVSAAGLQILTLSHPFKPHELPVAACRALVPPEGSG